MNGLTIANDYVKIVCELGTASIQSSHAHLRAFRVLGLRTVALSGAIFCCKDVVHMSSFATLIGCEILAKTLLTFMGAFFRNTVDE